MLLIPSRIFAYAMHIVVVFFLLYFIMRGNVAEITCDNARARE